MTIDDYTDLELAENLHLQAPLLSEAYETGDQAKIDNALNWVTSVRRMKSSGMIDLIAAWDDKDE
ncbi:MAG: hypothetical protein ABJ327_20780 [Litoreibacter sp.]